MCYPSVCVGVVISICSGVGSLVQYYISFTLCLCQGSYFTNRAGVWVASFRIHRAGVWAASFRIHRAGVWAASFRIHRAGIWAASFRIHRAVSGELASVHTVLVSGETASVPTVLVSGQSAFVHTVLVSGQLSSSPCSAHRVKIVICRSDGARQLITVHTRALNSVPNGLIHLEQQPPRKPAPWAPTF